MNKSKKLTAAMTASAVMAALVVPAASAAAPTFNDINNSFAKDAILKLAELGIINGKAEGTFDPTGNVTRAEFAKILVLSAGLDVSAAPATATFSDVATDAWSYKYVEAASKAKLINGLGNGTFGPNELLSREQMATMFVRALGVDVTGKGASLTFADKDQIADYAKDAVAYAVDLKLINGVGENQFNPKGSATREQIAKVANLFLDVVKAPADLKIEGDTNVGIGEKVQFKVAGALAPVWSVSGNGVIDQDGNFVGNAAGEATVTATVAGKSVTTKVQVYGAAAAVKISEVKDVVANTASTQDVTVTVVDKNGNAVENFTGFVDLAFESTTPGENDAVQLVQTDDSIGATRNGVRVKNGTVTVKVRSNGEVAGQTATLTVSGLAPEVASGVAGNVIENFQNATVDFNTVEQVATAVKLTTPTPIITANVGNATTDTASKAVVSAYVADQDGVAMKSGTYGMKLTISGPATWDTEGTKDQADSTTKEANLAFQGGVTAPSIEVYSVIAKTGNITINATADGLTAGTLSIKSAVTGSADKLVLKQSVADNTDNHFTQGSTAGVSFEVGALDENANPANGFDATGYTVYVTDANGDVATNFQINGADVDADGAYQLLAADAGVVTVTTKDGTATDPIANAGSYKLVVKDGAKVLKSSDAVNFIVNPDAATNVSLSTGTGFVAADKPSTTASVQVTDAFGNKLKKSGVAVKFTATTPAGVVSKASFNGRTAEAAPTVTVTTDENGVATANFAATAGDHVVWTIDAAGKFEGADYALLGGTADVTVNYTVTSSLKATLTANGGTVAPAGSTVAFTLDQLNAYGEPIDLAKEDDQVKVTISNKNALNLVGTAEWTADGSFTGSVTDVLAALDGAELAAVGNFTLTFTDLSVPSAKTVSKSLKVTPADFQEFALFTEDGKRVDATNPLSVEANKEVALFVKAVDAYGNVVADKVVNHITFDGDATLHTGDFRKVSNGVSINADGLDVPAGVTSVKVYYINTEAGTYVPQIVPGA